MSMESNNYDKLSGMHSHHMCMIKKKQAEDIGHVHPHDQSPTIYDSFVSQISFQNLTLSGGYA